EAVREHEGTVIVRWFALFDLFVFLAFRLPRDRLLVISELGDRGVGVVERDGSATVAVFAVDSLRRGEQLSDAMLRPRRCRWWLERYGRPGASVELFELLDEWCRLTRVCRSRLQIIARRSHGYDAELGFDWVA